MRSTLAVFALLLTACPTDAAKTASQDTPDKPAPDLKADAKAATKPATKPATAKAEPTPDAQPKSDAPVATVSTDVKFPLTDMLGKTPDEVQPKLGEPTGKGMTRESCIRFLPERTWFGCKFTMQRYADPTSTYDAITITYEDGVSTGVAFEGVPGEGDFDPKAALANLGVELIGEPKQTSPDENVTLWSWFNAAARLLVHDKQYRVQVSSVGGTWESSKVEFILNHPLTDAQKANVRATKASTEPSAG